MSEIINNISNWTPLVNETYAYSTWVPPYENRDWSFASAAEAQKAGVPLLWNNFFRIT